MLPTFQTERLILRPRTLADLEDCLAMDRDPLVTRYIPGPWDDAEEHRAFVIERMTTAYPKGLGYWTILEKDAEPVVLGWILLLPYEEVVAGEVEIGWRLRRNYWGQGYATEAASTVVQYAFDNLRIDQIVADIDPRNHPSIGVAQKLGFHFVEDRTIDGWAWASYQAKLIEY